MWIEVIEDASAAFAFLPVAAVGLLVTAAFLLVSRRELGAGILSGAGALTALHFVGVLLAASFAIGEPGGVRVACLLGVAGGILAGLAGWLTHRGTGGDPPSE